jgi:hypothetical protein
MFTMYQQHENKVNIVTFGLFRASMRRRSTRAESGDTLER